MTSRARDSGEAAPWLWIHRPASGDVRGAYFLEQSSAKSLLSFTAIKLRSSETVSAQSRVSTAVSTVNQQRKKLF